MILNDGKYELIYKDPFLEYMFSFLSDEKYPNTAKILNDSFVVNLKKPGRKFKVRKRHVVNCHGPTMRFWRYGPLPAYLVPLDSSCIDPGPHPLLFRDNYMQDLRSNQLEYNRRKADELEEQDRKFAELLRNRIENLQSF